jgi:hypothetical protein
MIQTSTSLSQAFQQELDKYQTMERLLTGCLLSRFKNIQSYQLVNARLCYDAYMKMNDRTYLIEVKVRQFEIDKYDSYFLEMAKLNNLQTSAKAGNLGILYINYFKTEDPEIYDYIIFNMDARFKEWAKGNTPAIQTISMNERTFVSTDSKIPKFVIQLKYEKNKDKKGTITLNY